jgi:hypothetical protein
MEAVKLLIALAAQEGWPVHHMDVKSAFLNVSFRRRCLSSSHLVLKCKVKNTRCSSLTRLCMGCIRPLGHGTRNWILLC